MSKRKPERKHFLKTRLSYTTYLAGPMQYTRYSGKGWRNYFEKKLKQYGIKVQDPLKEEKKKTGFGATRAKQLLKTLAALTIRGDKRGEARFLKILSEIVRMDFRAVHRCDFMIALVIEGVVSIGTTSEIIEASRHKIPVYIIYMGKPETFPHWMLYYVLKSRGKVFIYDNGLGFTACIAYLRNKFELEELERNGQTLKKKKKTGFKEKRRKSNRKGKDKKSKKNKQRLKKNKTRKKKK